MILVKVNKFLRLYPEFFVIISKIFPSEAKTLSVVMHDYQNKSLFWFFLLFISWKLLAPVDDSGIDIPHFDKVVHAGIFFVLTFLLIRAYRMSWPQYFSIFAVYGLITEYLQAQTGYRTSDPLDWFADMAGVVLLFTVCSMQQKRQKWKRQETKSRVSDV